MIGHFLARLRGRGGDEQALFGRALRAHQDGDLRLASELYEQLLARQPSHVDALNNLAGIRGQGGDLAGARVLLERGIAAGARHAGLQINLGNIERLQGRGEAAEAAYRQALDLDPDSVEARHALGVLLLDRGLYTEAHQWLVEAAERGPDNAQLWYDLGVATGASGALSEAAQCYQKAVALAPDHFPAYVNLGNVLRQLERLDEARVAAEKAVALDPHNAVAWNNLAGVLGSAGEAEAALALTDRAIAADPSNPLAHSNRGAMLASLGRLEEARQSLRSALEHDASADEARFTLALVDLSEARFESGFRNYEAGLRHGSRPWRSRGYPRWHGQAIAGHSLLLLPEQGVGDEIMFASCIPDLLEASQASRCVFECDPRLKPLMERSFTGIEVPPGPATPDGTRLQTLAPFDFEIPIGSLPLWLRREQKDFGSAQAFLRCDPLATARERERLDALGPGPKIGISWRGGHDVRTRRSRTIELTHWRPLLELEGVHFVSLQYGDVADDLASAAQSGMPVQHWPEPDPLADMDGFAALVACLDLVISIDNSTVHLAGAVGTPTWTLIPSVPDWRWQMSGEHNLWYASVRLWRQQAGDADWSQVFAALAHALQQEYARSGD